MTQTSGNILLIDDDWAIRQALRATLTEVGFTLQEAADGETGIELVKSKRFETVLLDINMPGIGGIETCRRLRRLEPVLPILTLTVRNSEQDIVRALEAGADDYVIKPFNVRELIARLKAAVRRSRATGNSSTVLSIGDIRLDPDRRTVKKNGLNIHLTPKEFDLLHHLMANAGVPVPHAKLLRSIWGPEYGNELEYLRTFVRQLRCKIEDDPARPTYLLTDPYVGYRFREAAAEEPVGH